MRVLFVCQWFPPEPVRVPVTIVESLAERGARVAVLTGTPNFPTGVVVAGHSPWRWSPGRYRGRSVLRAPLYPSHDDSAIRRMLNYASWALAAALAAATWRPAREAEVVLVYSSPATAALPAIIMRLLRRTPYVLLVEDLWPDSVTATGFFQKGVGARVCVPLLTHFVGLTYRFAHHIAVISPGMRRVLTERGVPDHRISVVHNWVREEPDQPDPHEGEDLHFVYGGNFGRAQGLDVIVRALAALDDPSVKVSFVGDGVCREELVTLAEELVPGQINFLPRMPLEEFQKFARSASALFVCLVEDPLFDITMPSKVQSSLAMGLPLIASCGRDVRDLVERANAGWTAPAGDVSSLAVAMAETRDAGRDERALRGRSGRVWYKREMCEEVNADRLLGTLRRASAQRTRR